MDTYCLDLYGSQLWKYSKNDVKGECSVFLKKIILWMKTNHYPNTLSSHLVTIVPMVPFTLKST